MARRAAAVRGRSGPSRTNWSRLVTAGFQTVPAATKVLLATFVLDNDGISETVRRTRGQVAVGSDQGAAYESQVGALGIMKVNDVALTAGAASIPGPVTEAADDGWFVWQPVTSSGDNGGGGISDTSVLYQFDSKAMRTVEQGFGLAVMFENGSATDGLRLVFALSLLSSRA